jgi:predicted esterase
MKRFSIVGLVLFLLTFTAFVGNAQDSDSPPKVETAIGIYDVQSPYDIHKFSARDIRKLVQMENGRHQGEGTIPHPVLVYCFDEKFFQYTGGRYQNATIKYRLHTPKTTSFGRKYPLIVHLHGRGEAGSNNTSPLVHLHSILPVLIGPEREDFFMLVTQCPDEMPGWGFRYNKDGTLDVLMAIMEQVIAENPIDKKRITVTGVSSGGWGVWELISKHPETFAGAVPTACGAPQQHRQLSALKRTPIWSFINKGDMEPDPIRTAMRTLNDAGVSTAFTEASASGHNAWRPAMEDYNCFRWMLAQKRGSWFSPPPGVIVHQPKSLLFIFVLFVLPIATIVFLSWERICELATTVWQSVRERMGWD